MCVGARGQNLFIVLFVTLAIASAQGQSATLPSSALPSLMQAIKHDFSQIDQIRTFSMSDDIGGEVDVAAVGQRRPDGYGVEVWKVAHGRVTKKWDSSAALTGVEFEVLGASATDLEEGDYDYTIAIKGCARHMCGGEISGYLIYSGKSGKTSRAKLVVRGLDSSPIEPPQYDVTFSPAISDKVRKELQSRMCSDFAISNKLGLPFECR